MANRTERHIITDVKARRLRAAKDGERYDVWDAVVPGLSLRVTDAGRKTWTVLGRIRGNRKVIRVTLGIFPVLSIATARDRARTTLEAMTAGRDPRHRGLSVTEAWKLYIAEKEWGNGHLANAGSAWRKHIEPVLGERRLREITRGDVAELVTTIKAPVNANRVRQITGGFFRWALERDLIASDPVYGVSRRRERARDRVYSDPEIRAVWNGSAALEWPYGPMTRFIFVTAQRRGQVQNMRRAEIDRERNLWTSPTKAGRLHPVPLSDLALEILDAAPERDPFVFSILGERGITNWGYIREHLKKQPGVPADFRLHDLRRTAATRMAELGVRREVVDAVLDHVQGGVSGVYNRYGYVDEMRHALSLWGNRLREILAAG